MLFNLAEKNEFKLSTGAVECFLSFLSFFSSRDKLGLSPLMIPLCLIY
jgi:hypothetical protein